MRSYVYRNSNGGYSFEKAARVPDSKQIPPDQYEEHYSTSGLVKPPYDFDLLWNLYEIDTWHRRAIIQKASDATGLGWDIVEDPNYRGEAKKRDRQRMVDFFNDASGMPLEDLLTQFWIDYDALGNGALEVIRSGKGEPVELYHVPFKTVRAHKNLVAYAQIRGTADAPRNISWFLEFGQEEVADVPRDWPSDPGELLVLKSYDARSSYYGIPEAISAIGPIAANTAARDYNIGKLVNRGVPDYIMTLEGVELDEETKQSVSTFLDDTRKKKLSDGPKILTFEVGTGEAKFERVTPEVEDANWATYRKDNRDETLAAHGMPKFRIGLSEESKLGSGEAQETSRVYADTIIRPRRKRMERFLSQKVIRNGFGIEGWLIEFKELDIRNEKEEAIADKARSGDIPMETLNEQRKKRRTGPPLEGGDAVYVTVGQAVVAIAKLPGAKLLEGTSTPIEPKDIEQTVGNNEPGATGSVDPVGEDKENGTTEED